MPLQWPLGASNLSHSDLLAMDPTYAQSFNQLTTSNDLYPEQAQNNQNDWKTGGLGILGIGAVVGPGAGQTPEVLGQNVTSHAEVNNITTSTTMILGYGNTALQDNLGGSNDMLGMSVGGFAETRTSISTYQDQALWEQQQLRLPYPNAAVNTMPFSDSTLPMMETNPLGTFPVEFEPSDTKSQFSVNVQELPAEQNIDDMNPPVNYTQEWQTGGHPQMGFGSIAAETSMDNVFGIQPASEMGVLDVTTCCSTPMMPATSGVQDNALSGIFGDIFTPEVLGIAGNTPSFSLSPAPNNYPPSHSSREFSIGTSPRTPHNWDLGSSPSPANVQHKRMGSDYQLDEGISTPRLDVFSTLKMGPAPPPAQSKYMINFETKPKQVAGKGKRSKFSKEGKDKVNSVRAITACISCHSRKVGVSRLMNSRLPSC